MAIYYMTEEQQPDGYFSVRFLEKVFSEYDENKVIFSTGTQDKILSQLLDDHDRMYEVQCCDSYRLFKDNPLYWVFILI